MANIRYALSYASFYGRTFEEFIQEAHRMGLSVVELIPDQSPNLYSEFDNRRADRLKFAMEELGMECTMHNVFYDINLLSLVPAVKSNSFAITESVIDLSLQLGALTLTIHPGYMFPGWRRDPPQRDRFWIEAKDSLSRLGALASKISILIENGSYHLCTRSGEGIKPLHIGIDPKEIDRLIDLSEGRIGICLDLGKAIHSGHKVEDFIKGRESLIKQVQVSSIQDHFGVIAKSINTLREADFSGTIVLEGQLLDVIPGLEALRKAGLE